jgi:RNA polymerase sigma-70 factor (ECF subfamily)
LEEFSEEFLLQRCVQGDESAFLLLLHPYRQMLARTIHARIDDPDDAEDVLQETLVAAWIGVRQLRDPGSVRAWLMQVAHNRCRDYFRAQGRRDLPTEARDLEERANRFGLRQYHQIRTAADVVEALEAVPDREREAAKRFYLEGLTIAEIAAETRCPPGTVKRRLFQARNALRQVLGVPLPERRIDMESQTKAVKKPAFPARRPKIVFEESTEPPYAVDCPELRWWSIIPRLGEQASWASYSPPGWKLTEVTELRVVRPAKVHSVEGVEIEVRPWKPETGWQTPWSMYGRLTDQKAQYLAVIQPVEGSAFLQTFLDEGFDWDWGEMDRVLEDQGRFVEEADGSLNRVRSSSASESSGAGIFSVEIGGKRFTCLRTLEVSDDVNAKTARLTESYLTREGRTVLTRHFCHPDLPDVAAFKIVVAATERLVIDGVEFVHWYDTLTHLAL